MFRYAHLNSLGVVIGIYQLSGEVERPDYIQSEDAEIGDTYNDADKSFTRGNE